MLVLKTDAQLSSEQKNTLRASLKKQTGEDCIILDMGLEIEQIRFKKEQPLWRRLFWRD